MAIVFALAVIAPSGFAGDLHAKCCAKAKAEGKECDHPCCVEAKKNNVPCEKCGGKKEEKKPS
jgi:hypothetical protein